MARILAILLTLTCNVALHAQTGSVTGKVTNALNKEPIPYATIVVEGTTLGGTSDDNGDYTITGLNPGIYNLKASFIGYKPVTIYEVQVRNAYPTFANVELEEVSLEMQEAIVTASLY